MKYMKSKDADQRVHSSRSAFALAQIVQGFRYFPVLATLSDSTSGNEGIDQTTRMHRLICAFFARTISTFTTPYAFKNLFFRRSGPKKRAKMPRII